MNWETTEQFLERYQKEGLSTKPCYQDPASVHNWLLQNTDLDGFYVYLTTMTADPLEALSVRASCTAACKEGEEILIGESRVYDYYGWPLVVNMWYPAAIARSMWN